MHRLSLAVLAATLLVVTAVAVALVAAVPERPGPHVALFAPRTSERDVMVAVYAAGGVIMRGSLLPGVWHVVGDGEAFAGELRQRGAWLVLPPLPLDWAALGGCSFLPPTRYTDLGPVERKARAGPM